MKKNLLLFYSLFLSLALPAQDFRGQWKGSFVDKSASDKNWGEEKCDYVLELETKGDHVTGSSITYFVEGGKKYYTICKLEGFIDRKKKYVEVKETERTKTNVPGFIRNCFQTHKLTYFKQGDSETLEGKWIPAPNQEGDCGYGVTILNRRLLKKVPGLTSRLNTTPKKSTVSTYKKPTPPVSKPIVKKPTVIAKKPNNQTSTDVAVKSPVVILPSKEKEKLVMPMPEFKKRHINVLKTIKVDTKSIKVDLYDNGEIDGDSITLFYNGKLLVSNKKLSDKALSFNLEVDNDIEVNELVMYAENLGSIPPNTALMVVTDGRKRYEVRITSDLQKSGVIHFVHQSQASAN